MDLSPMTGALMRRGHRELEEEPREGAPVQMKAEIGVRSPPAEDAGPI